MSKGSLLAAMLLLSQPCFAAHGHHIENVLTEVSNDLNDLITNADIAIDEIIAAQAKLEKSIETYETVATKSRWERFKESLKKCLKILTCKRINS